MFSLCKFENEVIKSSHSRLEKTCSITVCGSSIKPTSSTAIFASIYAVVSVWLSKIIPVIWTTLGLFFPSNPDKIFWISTMDSKMDINWSGEKVEWEGDEAYYLSNRATLSLTLCISNLLEFSREFMFDYKVFNCTLPVWEGDWLLFILSCLLEKYSMQSYWVEVYNPDIRLWDFSPTICSNILFFPPV